MSSIFSSRPSDLGDIVKAAESLNISEYDFFRLAHRRWSGHDPEPKKLEEIFVAYMFHQTVPHWVRHFVRDVLARAEAGNLNAVQLGALEFNRRMPPHRHGRLFMGVMAALTILYCVALTGITYDPDTSAPMPCYGGAGFKIWSSVAYAVTGNNAPDCKDNNTL